MSDANLVSPYFQALAAKRRALFDLYRDEDVRPRFHPRGQGWTWGYQLFVGGERETGASIGEDEIKLFFDLPSLIDARYMYTVGVAFGLSTFNLALARPEAQVWGIDNFIKGQGQEAEHLKRLVNRIIRQHVPNVRLCVGTSPQDVDACLSDLPAGEKLSLVFIDGMHTSQAAAADFGGVRKYLDEASVVLWHNTYSTKEAFEGCFPPELFDRRQVLHTYGVIGIYYNGARHPALEAYLRSNSLIWNDWETHLRRILPDKRSLRYRISSRLRSLWGHLVLTVRSPSA